MNISSKSYLLLILIFTAVPQVGCMKTMIRVWDGQPLFESRENRLFDQRHKICSTVRNQRFTEKASAEAIHFYTLCTHTCWTQTTQKFESPLSDEATLYYRHCAQLDDLDETNSF